MPRPRSVSIEGVGKFKAVPAEGGAYVVYQVLEDRSLSPLGRIERRRSVWRWETAGECPVWGQADSMRAAVERMAEQ
jgi:hypothetical protein